MRQQAILTRKHGAKSHQVLSGSEVPAHEQKAILKEFRRAKGEGAHEEFASVQLVEVIDEISFITPKEAEAKAKAAEKARAQAEAKRKAQEEAEKKAAEKPKAPTPPKVTPSKPAAA